MTEFNIEPGQVSVQWVANVTSDDVSTAVDIKPAEEYYRQGILDIIVAASIDKEDHWFQILDGDEVMLGPVPIAYGVPWHKEFNLPLYCSVGNALRIQTDSAFKICCVVDGYTDVEPEEATMPIPINDATDVGINSTLSWTSTPQIVSNNIYLNGTLVGSTSETTYNPDLEYSKTYNWRVDSSDGSTTATGETWTFTTESQP